MNTTTTEQATREGSYRTPDGRAQIEWELKSGDNGLEFSATGEYDGGAGQCIDSIAAAYPDDAQVQRIAAVWKAYHLNGMNAGTPEQTQCLQEGFARLAKKHPSAVYEDGTFNYYKLAELEGLKKSGSMSPSHYDLAQLILKRAKLYEVSLYADISAGRIACTGGFPSEVVTGARGYRYGERWIFRPIPAEIVREIESWADFPRADGSLSDSKAAAFLERFDIRCRITLSDTKAANWEPSGHHYRVTLSAGARRLTFDFWGSVADAEANEEASLSSVLSCVASDINTPATFEEFCSEYGEDADSLKANQLWRRADRFAGNLRGFFTSREIEALEEFR